MLILQDPNKKQEPKENKNLNIIDLLY